MSYETFLQSRIYIMCNNNNYINLNSLSKDPLIHELHITS